MYMNKAVTISKDKNGFFSVILTTELETTVKLECNNYQKLSDAEEAAQRLAKKMRLKYLSPIFRVKR